MSFLHSNEFNGETAEARDSSTSPALPSSLTSVEQSKPLLQVPSSTQSDFKPFAAFLPLDSNVPQIQSNTSSKKVNIDAGLHSSTTDSSDSDPEEQDDDRWEDVEPDMEETRFRSLFDEKEFQSLSSMLDYCRSEWNFDLQEIRSRLSSYDSQILRV